MLALAMIPLVPHARAVEEAAAAGPPFNVHVLLSSRADACYESGDVEAIRRLTSEEEKRINQRGGIAGRSVQVLVHEDARDQEALIRNMGSALTDPQSLALIGISSTARAKTAFTVHESKIATSGIPIISALPLDNLIEPFPNVFTMRASQDEDIVPLIANFTRTLGMQRIAFLSVRGFSTIDALRDGLKADLGESRFVAEVRLSSTDGKIPVEDIVAAVGTLKTKQPDILFLYVGPSNADTVIEQLVAAGLTPALFNGSQFGASPSEVSKRYPNAIYNLYWGDPPEVFNNRLRNLISPKDAGAWIFEGSKIDSAPGWKTGECKLRVSPEFPDPFEPANLRAISNGSKYADMVALVAEAARSGPMTADVTQLRARVLRGLSEVYQTGRGSFKGTFENWSFVKGRRSAALNPLVTILPQGLGRVQLAPYQYVRSNNGRLRPMDTLYIDIDLIKAHRIDENEKTFFAEFFLSMRNNEDASLDRIEFANAVLDTEAEGGRELTIEVIHPGGPSAAYPEGMKIYKISGRFVFEPRLSNYPFDTQRFSIDIQPKNFEKPFIVQPPPLELRDKIVTSYGWDTRDQYVGYDRDFVPIVDAYTHQPSVVPFYRASFVWLLERRTTDYLLRVAVPLAFILFVAYFSIFIPMTHFEAIVTIQVTALLSAVALYLSLPGLSSDTATLSDRAFVLTYLILSLMIALSILRISPPASLRATLDAPLWLIHIVGLPLCFLLIAAFALRPGFAP